MHVRTVYAHVHVHVYMSNQLTCRTGENEGGNTGGEAGIGPDEVNRIGG